MKIAKKLAAVLLASLMIVSFGACGKKSGSVDNYIDIHINTEVTSLDPQEATDGTSFGVQSQLIEGLTGLDKDGNTEGLMAEGWSVSDDNLTWTFNIRKDAYWTNGDPVTAQDFVDAFQTLVDPVYNSEYAYMGYSIMQVKGSQDVFDGKADKSTLGVRAVDEKTFEVTLEYPCPFMLSLTCFNSFYPRNQKFIDSCGENYGTSPETFIGCGPFKLVEYEPSTETIVLDKNEKYYNADSVKLDGLRYHVIKDAQSAILAYENNELDYAVIDGSLVETYKDNPEFQVLYGSYLWYLSLNMGNEHTFKGANKNLDYLKNLNLRKALMRAYDREAVANNVVKDGSIAADYVYPKGLASAPDGRDVREYVDAKTVYADCLYNKEEAYKLYEAAAAELGVTDFDFELVVEDNQQAQDVAAFIQGQFKDTFQGHVNVHLKVETKKARLADMNAGNFEIGLTRWGPDYADPMTYTDLWSSSNAQVYDDGTRSLGGGWDVVDPELSAEYDKKVKACKDGSLSIQDRWDTMMECEKILMENAIILPVYQKNDASLIKGNVKGIEFHAIGMPTVYRNAYIEK